MVREVSAPADSFWEDGYEDENECERFLQNQKHGANDDEENDYDAEEGDDAEDTEDETAEDAENVVVAEADADADEDEDDVEDDDDDDSEEDDDDVAAEAEEDSEEDAAKPTGAKMSTAKAKAGAGGMTKADAIRASIERRKASGGSLRPCDIIEELAGKGCAVNASQVSVTLRAMGVPAGPRGRKAGAKVAKPAAGAAEEPKSRVAMKRGMEEAKPSAAKKGGNNFADLEAAADFADSMGGYERATELLEVCRRMRERN